MKYKTIVIDPPWILKMGKTRTFTDKTKGNWPSPKYYDIADLPYPTMSYEQLAELPIKQLAEKNSHLYLWTINSKLEEAYRLVRDWGFSPSTLLTWCKSPMGMGLGGAFVPTTEFIIFARKGSLKSIGRRDSTWFHFKRGKHSVKPDGFYEIVEKVSPGPYLEMFARRTRKGWDVWGNEVESDVTISPIALTGDIWTRIGNETARNPYVEGQPGD